MLSEDEYLTLFMLSQDLGEFPCLRYAVVGYVPGFIPGKERSSGSRISAAPHNQLLEVGWATDGKFDFGEIV